MKTHQIKPPLPLKVFTDERTWHSALEQWAAATQSKPEGRWFGPGTYQFSGYMSDENAPVATLDKVSSTCVY